MPVVIPVIAAFATGAMGVAAIGAATTLAATVAGYAMVAGAVLSGVGALTGSKSLSKIGGFLSLAGGIGSLASAATSAAGAGTEVGLSGMDLAADAAAGTGNSIATAGASLGDAATNAVDAISPFADINDVAGAAGGVADPTAAAVEGSTVATAPDSIMGQALKSGQLQTTGTPVEQAGALSAETASTTPLSTQYSVQATTTTPTSGVSTALKDAASNMNGGDLASWWDKAMKAGKGAAKFMQDNPNLMKVGGEMLSSMYGPNAERLDMEKSMMERARANLNAPIALKYKTGG